MYSFTTLVTLDFFWKDRELTLQRNLEKRYIHNEY